jgi:hypothetical protein
MILVRHVSHYVITYYLPSGLFVVVSWISFLVPPDVIPGKCLVFIKVLLFPFILNTWDTKVDDIFLLLQSF